MSNDSYDPSEEEETLMNLGARLRDSRPPTEPIPPVFRRRLRAHLLEKNEMKLEKIDKQPSVWGRLSTAVVGFALIVGLPLFFWMALGTNRPIAFTNVPQTATPPIQPTPTPIVDAYDNQRIFGGRLQLAAYDVVPVDSADGMWTVQLDWLVRAPSDGDLTRFVHVVDADGRILTQDDTFYAAEALVVGEIISESVSFAADFFVDGFVEVGWYEADPLSQTRLVLEDGQMVVSFPLTTSLFTAGTPEAPLPLPFVGVTPTIVPQRVSVLKSFSVDEVGTRIDWLDMPAEFRPYAYMAEVSYELIGYEDGWLVVGYNVAGESGITYEGKVIRVTESGFVTTTMSVPSRLVNADGTLSDAVEMYNRFYVYDEAEGMPVAPWGDASFAAVDFADRPADSLWLLDFGVSQASDADPVQFTLTFGYHFGDAYAKGRIDHQSRYTLPTGTGGGGGGGGGGTSALILEQGMGFVQFSFSYSEDAMTAENWRDLLELEATLLGVDDDGNEVVLDAWHSDE